MLPDLIHLTQISKAFHTKGWVYEEKYDGWRMLAPRRQALAAVAERSG